LDNDEVVAIPRYFQKYNYWRDWWRFQEPVAGEDLVVS